MTDQPISTPATASAKVETAESIKVWSYTQGRRAARRKGELFKLYLAVVLGVLLHFIWEVAVAVAKDGKDADIGDWYKLAARVIIAFIVAAVSFVGIYKQLENVDRKILFFQAITLGFAIDALANPIAPVATTTAA